MEREGTYQTEHWLSWLLGIAAITLGVIGALEGFAVIDIGNAIGGTEAAVTPVTDADLFQDGALFLVPALVMGFLAFTLHRAEHHSWRYELTSLTRSGMTGTEMSDRRREEGLWNAEHALAYLATLVAIGLSIIGILVGFNVLEDTHSFYDGMIWQLLAVLSSFMAGMLHSVGHHAPAYELEDIRVRIEERVSGTSTEGIPGRATQPRIDRR